MRNFLYIIALLIIFQSCKEEGFGDFGGDKTFVKYYGTVKTDVAFELLELADKSGYAFIGTTNSKALETDRNIISGQSEIYFVKTDKFGTVINSTVYGSAFDGDTVDFEAMTMKQTTDGGFIIGGTKINNTTSQKDMFLLKLDNSGQQEGEFKVFNTENATTEGVALTLIEGGGYALNGSILEDSEIEGVNARLLDMYTIRTDENRNVNTDIVDDTWIRSYGSDGRKNDKGEAILEADNGEFVWLGTADVVRNSTDTDIRIAGFNDKGVPIWDVFYGTDGIEEANDIQKTNDGGYIVVGTTSNGDNGGMDVLLIKIDAQGGLQWQKNIGTGDDEIARSVKQTRDNGFIITGVNDKSGQGDVYLVKVDSQGNEEWYRTFGGDADDIGMSVIQTSDQGYLITGAMNFESIVMTMLIKTDKFGKISDAETINN